MSSISLNLHAEALDDLRERTRRSGNPATQSPARAALRGRELRRAHARAATERVVRPRAGRIHRGGREQAGLLEVADGGTIFLDEIGDLSPDAQTTLLRFLQSGEIRAVGSTRTMRVDVRTIAATNRDLDAAIAERTFREDLYYRLADVVLEVPPLRERREDIPLLAEHFRTRFNEQLQLAIEPLGPETLSALEDEPWRGNVRELEKTMKVAMVFRREGGLRAEDLRVRARPLTTRRTDGPIPLSSIAHLPVSRRVQAALRIAGERGVVTRRDLARECGVSGEIARQALGALERLGFLRRVGRGRSTIYVMR